MSKDLSQDNSVNNTDQLLIDIADYVDQHVIRDEVAIETAYYAFWDSLGCALLALAFPECRKHLGSFMPGAEQQGTVRVPGTNYRLDPITAAFNIGTLIRWLDFNDTWLAKEWGHPSDNLGAILAVADYLSQQGKKITMQDVLIAQIKAYEIQGILALDNSFNRVGLDHVVLVKVASTAVVTKMLGGTRSEIINAVSQAWVDGQSLRTYRHAPNTGSRKSWAAGDATSRAVRLATMTLRGEMGYASVLSAPVWGFEDVHMHGEHLTLARKLDSYVMENILFKISFPAEFHAQTAVECAIKLHPQVKNKIHEIERIQLTTQEPGVRIISKTGKLNNYADRDHCLQYMVAIGLLYGELKAEHYDDEVAMQPEVDALREKMVVTEDESFTKNYYDLDKRAIGNSIQVEFTDGTKTDLISIEYPVGHRNRRDEGIPLLQEKLHNNLDRMLNKKQAIVLKDLFADQAKFSKMPVADFMQLLVQG